MKIGFLILVLIHGLIHSLGFLKAFEISELKELSLPVSKAYGVIWLLAAISILVYALMFALESKYHWLTGIIAILISQFLVFYFWKDAKFATIINLLILATVIYSYGNFQFRKLVEMETSQIFTKTNPGTSGIFSQAHLSGLPTPIQKWLFNSGAIGKELILWGRIEQKMLMKMKPGQQNWYSAKALQYINIENPAFIWTVEMDMNKIMKIKGRDKFIDGKGEMLIKLFSLINLVNAAGDKMDEGTIQRYLGELVWFPTLALSPYISWEQIDDYSAKAIMNYNGTSGSGVFYFDEQGDFVKFSAMRFKDIAADSKRFEWILTVDDYKVFEGIKVPSRMKATWKLDEGDWTWLDLEITDLKYNEIIR